MSDELVGRYRRLYVRIWDDPKFRNLSATEQRLTLYVLTGPQSNRIGLFKFSIPRAADDLKLGVGTVRQMLSAVCGAFDWRFDADARVLYLPNWWRWNTSVNTNILVGSLKDLSEIPLCALVTAFANNLSYIPPKLHESFRKALGERSPQHSPTSGSGTGTGAGTGAGIHTALARGEEASGKLSIPHPLHHRNGIGLRERFESFWKVYPKKVAKDAAWRAWQKRKPSLELTETICAALAWQGQQDGWLKEGGQYIPNPATWLTQGRWQDEPHTTQRVSGRTLSAARAHQEFLK